MANVVPFRSGDRTSIEPPCARTISLAMNSPSPTLDRWFPAGRLPTECFEEAGLHVLRNRRTEVVHLDGHGVGCRLAHGYAIGPLVPYWIALPIRFDSTCAIRSESNRASARPSMVNVIS